MFWLVRQVLEQIRRPTRGVRAFMRIAALMKSRSSRIWTPDNVRVILHHHFSRGSFMGKRLQSAYPVEIEKDTVVFVRAILSRHLPAKCK